MNFVDFSSFPRSSRNMISLSALRPYQAAVVRRAVELYDQGTRRLLVPLATGLGKTVVFTHLPQAFPALRRKGTLVLVHRDELVRQALSSFRKFLPHLSLGVEKGSETANPGLDVVVASVQTLGRKATGAARLRKYRDYGGVVIVDEAHHLTQGGMYDDILNGLGVGSACGGETRDARLLAGFTATPRRADGKSLRPFFDHSVGGLDLQWGISNGYLVDIHAYTVRTATNIGAVEVRQQDFVGSALSEAVNNGVRNAAAARSMLEFGAGEKGSDGNRRPRAIAFCADVRHAHDLARVLNHHGVSALAVDGSMGKQDRLETLSAFESGRVSTLTNCGVLTEGFDAPFCDTVVMCRPTQSTPLYMQMLGRGTRPWLIPRGKPGTVPRTIPGAFPETTSASRSDEGGTRRVMPIPNRCNRAVQSVRQVLSMATALGLPPTFGGGDAVGSHFSVEHVSSLAKEAFSFPGAFEEVAKVKTPSELAILVKHYRLLQGSKGAETLIVDTSGVGESRDSTMDLSSLSVGDIVGKDSSLKVVVDDIDMETREEDGEDYAGDADEWDELPAEDEVEAIEAAEATTCMKMSRRKRNMKGNLGRCRRSRKPTSAIVLMRDEARGVSFAWRTTGVKDTHGEELHEGGAYRLVGSVRDAPDVAGRKVVLTRCRLTPIQEK